MKKYLFLLLLTATGLLSCNDDDSPVIPELNKLTKITCYVNDKTTPDYVLDINYTSDGKIHDIQLNNENRQLFIYTNNTLIISNSSPVTTEYQLSGNIITQSKVSKVNQYAHNEIYVSDEYNYRYNSRNLSYTDRLTRWPKTDGTGYETRSYPREDVYTWESGNVVLYAQDKSEMRYEYSSLLRPLNFPIRLSTSFNPVGVDIVTPFNLMFGNPGRNLPERAFRYTIPESSKIVAEYNYNFIPDGDYIKAMIITEKNNTVGEEANNTYKYSFEYNFKVK